MEKRHGYIILSVSFILLSILEIISFDPLRILEDAGPKYDFIDPILFFIYKIGGKGLVFGFLIGLSVLFCLLAWKSIQTHKKQTRFDKPL